MLQGLETSNKVAQDWKLRLCVICDKRFERRNDCKRHYIEHLLADAYKEKIKHGFLMCQICGSGFQKRDGYKRHMRDHASLPVYICEICDKTFSDSSNFCKHKKVHNLAVLICDICKKKFNNKQYLIKHIQMHQVIKPIDCKTCDKVFYTPSSYNKHLKSNRARFKCQICDIFFNSLKEKWDHMWQVHKERKYEADCPVCEKSFRKFQEVKQHLKDEHNERNYVFYNSDGKTKLCKRVKSNDRKVIVI
ncbi:unnamed protein product [Euphydryas editha]|uniref:C2H2-type domain-containing protein n=1 Tax=Euphydryas editha TaxID=104508 RepID=A0AAU9T949_EUPED|nr:unnamed protein product [Euphydryas editha]